MKENVKSLLLGILLAIVTIALMFFSGFPVLYLIDLPTIIALITITTLLYGIRKKHGMDIVRQHETAISSLWIAAFLTFFIGIMAVLTNVREFEALLGGLAVALIVLPYTALLWLILQAFFNYRAKREKDIYSDVVSTNELIEQSRQEYIGLMENKNFNVMIRTHMMQQWQLTKREIEIANELYKGKTNREIAASLFISEMTVKKHMANIFSKVGVSNRQTLIVLLHQKE